MKSILEVSKEGITIHQIPLSDRLSVGSEEWKKIPDRSISSMDSNIQFRLIDGKNLMVYLLDQSSKITLKGKEHLGPKTILVPHNENLTVETGHTLKLSTDLTEDKKVFSKATIFKTNLPGLKIDGVPVVFDGADDAVDIVETSNSKDEEFFDDDIDEIKIEEALNEKVELNKLYYDDEDEIEEELEEKLPSTPPPVNEIKTDEEKENEAVDIIVEVSNEDNEIEDPNDFEIDIDIDSDELQDEIEVASETVEDEDEDEVNMQDVDIESESFEEINDSEISIEDDTDPGISIEGTEQLLAVEEAGDSLLTDEDITDPGIALSDDNDLNQQEDEKSVDFDEMTDPAFEARSNLTAEDIVIGEDFSEQVLEDLQNIEKQDQESDQSEEEELEESQGDDQPALTTDELLAQFRDENPLDEADIPENFEEEQNYEHLAVNPSKEDNVEVPDDEEWEKIQAEMQSRLQTEDSSSENIDQDQVNEIEQSDKTNPGFNFEQSFDDEEDEEENYDDVIVGTDEEEVSKPSFKERLTGLFTRKKKSSAEVIFDPDAEDGEQAFQEADFEEDNNEIDLDKMEEEDIDEGPEENNKEKKNILSNMIQSFKALIGNKMRSKKKNDEPHPEIVFDEDATGTSSVNSEPAESHLSLAPDQEEDDDDEDINYEELGFEKPEVSEIHVVETEKPETSKRFTSIAKIKKIFGKKQDNDNFDEQTGTSEVNDFNEFQANSGDGTQSEVEIQAPPKSSFIDKIKNIFKKKTKNKDEEDNDDDFEEMTNAQIAGEEIAEAMDESFDQDLEEEDEDEEVEEKKSSPLIKGKKGKKNLLKAAKEGKKSVGQDPKPGVVARVVSLLISFFIVFNLYHFIKKEPQVNKFFKMTEKHFIKTKAPAQKLLYQVQEKMPKQIPPKVRGYLTKYYNPDHLKFLYQKENQRLFILFVVFELLFLLMLGNSLPLFVMGARSENNPGQARIQAVVRFLLWPITLLLPILDIGLLFNRRSFREVITKSYINYPSTSFRNIVLFIGFPLFTFAFFCWPFFTNLEVFSSREIKVSKYKPVSESELEYSNVLDISLKPKLKSGFVFIPAWEIGRKQQMQASLKIYSIKTDQQAYMKKYRSIDLPKILKGVTKYDPLFFRFHPKLKVFIDGKLSQATKENYKALNDYLLDCLSISAFDYKSLVKLYKTGPYINDDLTFKKKFLKHIDQIGIQKIIVHQNRDEKTLEIVPSRQSGVQSSYFLALNENQNSLYSLTYSKKATDTRKEITKLSLNQMSFTYKSETPVSDPAIQTLEHLKQVVNPNYTEGQAFSELFKYYYSLSKRAIESNKKPFIDLARKEVVRTGDLIGKLKQEPKMSQKYREKFRNLSRALETLDVRYFSL